MEMYKNQKSGRRSIHLYNPKIEGLGGYDINYINALKQTKEIKNLSRTTTKERFVA
tara:strand:+ start:1360 stop:1527 length:168 start_codon:yes stop_codon:yes gene_type:complete